MPVTRKFQIEVLRNREVTETVNAFEKDEDGIRRRTTKVVTRVVPESFMCYFPGGHSIWVETKAQLAQLDLLPDANVEIDTDTGLPVLPPQMQDIKSVVNKRTVNHKGI